MATHKSAEKRARQSIKRNKINRARRSVIQGHTSAVEHAIAGNDAAAAQKALREAESALARGAGRGTLHWKGVWGPCTTPVFRRGPSDLSPE